MTSNQIAYQSMLEAQRANRAKEAELYRSNLANEQEMRRANVTKEALSAISTFEQARANRAKEKETYRSNVASEEISRSKNQMNLGTSIFGTVGNFVGNLLTTIIAGKLRQNSGAK